jgi:hypothetical protein
MLVARKATSLVKTSPSRLGAETSLVNTSTSLETLDGWDQLNKEEMELVRSKSQSLSEALYIERKSRVATGKILIELRAILEPKGMWRTFLDTGYRMSRSTAYNYINDYNILAESLPAEFVEIVIQRGYNLRREVLKRMPPPKTEDPEKIIHYLEAVQKKEPKATPVVVVNDPPDEILKDCVHYVGKRWKKLPKRGHIRERFKTDFMNMCLWVFGATSAERFHPIEVPPHLTVYRGRPRKQLP